MDKRIDVPKPFDRQAFIFEIENLLRSISTPGDRIVLDLSNSDILDTGEISALAEVQIRAAEKKTIVRLVGISEEMRLVLVLSKLDDRFEIEGL